MSGFNKMLKLLLFAADPFRPTLASPAPALINAIALGAQLDADLQPFLK